MIISEKGLVRAIKRAYKNSGYVVMNTGDAVAIYRKLVCSGQPRPAAAQGVGHHRGTHGHDPGARYAHVDH